MYNRLKGFGLHLRSSILRAILIHTADCVYDQSTVCEFVSAVDSLQL